MNGALDSIQPLQDTWAPLKTIACLDSSCLLPASSFPTPSPSFLLSPSSLPLPFPLFLPQTAPEAFCPSPVNPDMGRTWSSLLQTKNKSKPLGPRTRSKRGLWLHTGPLKLFPTNTHAHFVFLGTVQPYLSLTVTQSRSIGSGWLPGKLRHVRPATLHQHVMLHGTVGVGTHRWGGGGGKMTGLPGAWATERMLARPAESGGGRADGGQGQEAAGRVPRMEGRAEVWVSVRPAGGMFRSGREETEAGGRSFQLLPHSWMRAGCGGTHMFSSSLPCLL